MHTLPDFLELWPEPLILQCCRASLAMSDTNFWAAREIILTLHKENSQHCHSLKKNTHKRIIITTTTTIIIVQNTKTRQRERSMCFIQVHSYRQYLNLNNTALIIFLYAETTYVLTLVGLLSQILSDLNKMLWQHLVSGKVRKRLSLNAFLFKKLLLWGVCVQC